MNCSFICLQYNQTLRAVFLLNRKKRRIITNKIILKNITTVDKSLHNGENLNSIEK